MCILVVAMEVKAPVGFEPTSEDFADPAVRPLRHSAICRGSNVHKCEKNARNFAEIDLYFHSVAV